MEDSLGAGTMPDKQVRLSRRRMSYDAMVTTSHPHVSVVSHFLFCLGTILALSVFSFLGSHAILGTIAACTSAIQSERFHEGFNRTNMLELLKLEAVCMDGFCLTAACSRYANPPHKLGVITNALALSRHRIDVF